MGDSPMGPFEFKGLIMEQSPTGCWTNHHSLVEYKGQWYLFYHHNDYSPEFDKNRSARIDSLSFNPDGTIRQVIPTLRGVGVTDARKEIQIDRYSSISKTGASIDFLNQADKFEGWKLVLGGTDAWAAYNTVDFGNGKLQRMTARVLSDGGGTLQVTAGGKLLAEVKVPASTAQWETLTVPVKASQSGICNLWIGLVGGSGVQVDWIRFE